MVSNLLKNKHAYEKEKHVYFSVSSFKKIKLPIDRLVYIRPHPIYRSEYKEKKFKSFKWFKT